jgi:tetratricopeptide (TPR) repeat protein
MPRVLAGGYPGCAAFVGESESSRAEWLTYRGFETGRRIGELENALRIVQQEEALCLELGNKDGLQHSSGSQALILQAWGRLEEAFELHKKVEALCLELGNKHGLMASYGNQAAILNAWGRLEEAFELLKKVEALYLELGNKHGLSRSYGSQALILQAWGRLEDAFELLKKVEALCLELGNKDGLMASYGNQAGILNAWGRREEAFELHKKEGNRSGLAYCYWNWGLLARKQRDRETERGKLAAALDKFTELNMPRERDAVRAELEKTAAAECRSACSCGECSLACQVPLKEGLRVGGSGL